MKFHSSLLTLLLLTMFAQSSIAQEQDMQKIQRLFVDNCADCHGSKGAPGEMKEDFPSIPDFTNTRWQKSRNNSQLCASILNGMGDDMPAFDGDVSRDDAIELVKFIRTCCPEYAKSNPSKPATKPSEFGRRMQTLREAWAKLQSRFASLRHE